MRRFFVADLNLRGDLQATAEYRYEQLEQIPGAAELIVHFATHLYRHPEEFEVPLNRHKEHLIYRWRASAETAGITTLRANLHGGPEADLDQQLGDLERLLDLVSSINDEPLVADID